MNDLIEMWHNLPTGGKWALGLGAVGIVLYIWKSKGSAHPQTTPSGQWVVAPDPNAGIPNGTPLGGNSYYGGGSGTAGVGQDGFSGGGTTVGFGGSQTPTGQSVTPNPTTTGIGSTQTGGTVSQPQVNTLQTIQAITAINATAHSMNPTTSQLNNLHVAKTTLVQSIGMTNDSWGQVRDSGGNINPQLSAKFTSAGAINTYATQNQGHLSATDYNTLHLQKVAIEMKQGNTVTADGHVYDSHGKAVGINGMG